MRDARKAVLKPPHSPAMRDWRDHQTSPHRAKRLDCARVHRRFSPDRPSQNDFGSGSFLRRRGSFPWQASGSRISRRSRFHPKAPEGWRTPRRFAQVCVSPANASRLGLRWPSTALLLAMSLRWSFGLFGGQTTKMPALRALKNPCSIRVSSVAKIQTPIVPAVHFKMNTGKETVDHAEFGMRDARKAVLKPPHSPAMRDWRDHQTSPHRAKRLDCARVHRRFSPDRPS
jgi:hypothetical protein